jgi:phospholipase/carboxylesterase
MITRRRFGVLTRRALASFALGGPFPRRTIANPPNDGRLAARPQTDVRTSAKGQSPLGLDRARDAILQVPAAAGDAPLPLLVLFHGSGGSARGVLGRIGSAPGDAGIVVLAPDSRGSTWDAIRSGFGPDVAFLNRALERVFETVAVDPARIAVGGFSDGATYALSLGLINGDLFSIIAAFSPGSLIAGSLRGTPRIYISHGDADPVLPIDLCSRRIDSDLRKRGYDVTFREFHGGHEIPAAVAREAMARVAGAPSLRVRHAPAAPR